LRGQLASKFHPLPQISQIDSFQKIARLLITARSCFDLRQNAREVGKAFSPSLRQTPDNAVIIGPPIPRRQLGTTLALST
jgi:hypothetical protein